MASRRPHLSLVGLLFLILAFAPRLAAQNVLVVESGGKGYVVQKVRSGRPIVEKDGKLVSVTPGRCGLKPVAEFLPAFVSVRDIKVGTSHVELVGGGDINHDFNLEASFTSTYTLDDVFLVLELDTEQSGKMIFFYEVGDLGPGKVRSLNLHVPTNGGLGTGKYQMHLFTEGMELFHSEHPMPYRESMLDKMVAKRIAGVKDANPKPFFGPTPEYPKALKKAGTKGEALLSIRITRTGAVLDPTVISTTDPAFGEAALVAVRLWRFLPKMENGNPVEMKVNLPFEFSPPDEKSKG